MPLTPERISRTQDTIALSSPVQIPLEKKTNRPKKPPPVTPRRFRKFFTPRPLNSHHVVRTSRKALRDITTPALNRKKQKTEHASTAESSVSTPHLSTGAPSCSRKRKFSFASVASSLQSSPIKRGAHFSPSSHELQEKEAGDRNVAPEAFATSQVESESEQEEEEDEGEDEALLQRRVPPVRQYRNLTTSTNLLSLRLSGIRSRKETQNSKAWQDETANFFSGPLDVHSGTSHLGQHMTLPFCITSCNTNSLVAIGDEEGVIRLIDSAEGDKVGFSKTYLYLRPHENALLDLSFSPDDVLLATASGDQTARIIDVQSQKTTHCLSGHTSSVKRIVFQPASNNNIVATCSRDGSIRFWDLRCPATERLPWRVRNGKCTLDANATQSIRCVTMADTIFKAHAPVWPRSRREDVQPPRTADLGRDGISVTSLAFLGAGREHMLVTSSEADATVKLWDMRTSYSARRFQPLPVSSTREPSGHEGHRRWGLTSIAFSGDGARLYTLCRDHTVYTYSTSHLVLGDVPELSGTTMTLRPRRALGSEREGLGPLYGFCHPRLKVTTFYTKLAVRTTHDDKSELLAVGSSDDCALLFPTNERYLTKGTRYRLLPLSREEQGVDHRPRRGDPPPSLHRTTSSTSSTLKTNIIDDDSSTIPIYTHGTPLIRGHQKEVTSLAWTTEGSLVTVADDFSARCWRDQSDSGVSRALRQLGEGEGRRWGCGWADLDNYDGDGVEEE